ncbi:MAG: urea transporter [Treponema bryantii]|nr:urea transporter [Treponema bryantii]
MKEINIKKLQDAGFKQFDSEYIGKVNNHFFSIKDNQASEDLLYVTISIAPSESKNILFKYLDDLQKDNKIDDYELTKNEIKIALVEDSIYTIDIFLSDLSKVLEEIEAKNICNFCENTENIDLYVSSKVHSFLCQSCGEKLLTDLQEEKNIKPKYLLGFFASLVGALIGSVVWVVLGMLGFIASLAGYAIAYGAFYAYKKVNSKYTKLAIILNVVAIIIAFLFAQYSGIVFEVLREYKADGITFSDAILYTNYLFTNKEFIVALLPDFGFGILFAFLGSFRTIKDNYTSAKEEENFYIEKVDF